MRLIEQIWTKFKYSAEVRQNKEEVKNRKFTNIKDFTFDVSVDLLEGLLRGQDFKCAATGEIFKVRTKKYSSLDWGEWLPLRDNLNLEVSKWADRNKNERTLDYNVSIDRIDSDKGYIADNIKFVTKEVNMIMRDTPKEDFLRTSYMIVEHHKKQGYEFDKVVSEYLDKHKIK